MTPGIQFASGFQIAKLFERLDLAVRAERFPADLLRDAMNHQPDLLTPELLAVVRKHVEGGDITTVSHIQVNRGLAPWEVIESIGGHQHIDPEVLQAVPTGLGEEVDLGIIEPSSGYYQEGRISSLQVAELYGANRLTPDPRALAEAFSSQPLFRDGRHYATQWQVGGVFCFLAGCCHKDDWYVHMGRSPESWGEEWRFVGTLPVNMDPHF